MATINPSFLLVIAPAEDVPVLTWEGAATGDDLIPYGISEQAGIAGSVQIDGTFGGATVTLEASNDGVTFFPLSDLQGNAISATAAAFFDFTTAAALIRPAISGGSGDSLNIRLTLRG